MPLPSPKGGKNRKDFISECMSNGTMNKEFPDTKQRVAVCNAKWKESQAIEIDFTEQIKSANEGKTLNKPFRTPKGPKKFSVYVKNEKGNVVKVNFGDPNMEIKRDDPERRKSFRARHNCDNPGPKWKARYWSCKQWRAGKKVEGSSDEYEWDGETAFDHDELLAINPELAYVKEEVNEPDDCGCDECGCGKDKEEEAEAKKKGLWENIRDKKKREGKNYRPAKPGDPDYPDEKALKKAQKKSKDKKK